MLVAKKELNYYPEEIEIRAERQKTAGKNRNRKKKSHTASKLIAIGIAIVGLVLSLFILYRYANITKVRLEITELEKQKLELEKEKENLIAELEGIKTSAKIEEEAMIKLGMDYPTDDQVVYVDVVDISLEENTDTIDEFIIVKQLKNIANRLLDWF